MGYGYKWKPSKTAAREYSAKMDEISEYCAKYGIGHSGSNDSYYFAHDGLKYRISNHSVEASNRAAYDDLTGENRRELYHKGGRDNKTVYIHAGKTRIIEIHQAIL